MTARKAVGSDFDYLMPAYKPKQREIVRVKTKISRSPNYAIIFGVLLVTVLFSVALSYTFIKAVEAKANFELTKTEQTNQDIAMQNEKMKLDIARLKSLDRIETIAVNTMGMIKNPEVQYMAMQDVKRELADASATQTGLQADKGDTESLTAGQKIINGIVMALKERTPVDKG